VEETKTVRSATSSSPDGANMQAATVDRQTGDKLSSIGRPGRMAGNFKWAHNMAVDSRARSLRPRVGDGRRAEVQAAELTPGTHLRGPNPACCAKLH
jgi:hypothetical protein